MEPLKITAVMQDGRVAGTEQWFPLDSMMAGEWIRKNYPEAYYNASSHMSSNELIAEKLPLAKRGHDKDWYWACSFNQSKPITEYIMHWHKRFDDNLDQYINFGNHRGRVDIKSGKFKAYRMPLVIKLFDKLVWYAFGDKDEVMELCKGITHIGKKSSQGLGMVDYWMVESTPSDYSEYREGKVMRAIPVELGLPEGIDGHIEQYGLRPPYWYIDNARICYIPEAYRG